MKQRRIGSYPEPILDLLRQMQGLGFFPLNHEYALERIAVFFRKKIKSASLVISAGVNNVAAAKNY